MSETLEQLAKRLDATKLFRARPKRLEDLPEWTKCCEKQIAETLAMPDMIIDLSRTVTATTYCNWCDFEKPPAMGAVDTDDGKYVHLAELDIDEKPISEELRA